MKLFPKITLSASLLTLATLAAIPLTTGFWLKNHYQSVLNQLTDSPNLSIKVVKFHRGWLHSTATVQVTMRDLWLPLDLDSAIPLKTQATRLTLEQHIQNGPFVFEELPNKHHHLLFAKALIHTISDNPHIPFNATLLIHSKNTFSGFLHAPKLNVDSDITSIRAKNVNADFTYTTTEKALTGHLHIQSATVAEQNTSNKASLSAEDLSASATLKQRNTLWYGARDTSIGRLAFTTHAGEQSEWLNTHFDTRTNATGPSTHINVKASSDQMTFDNMVYKPFNLHFSIQQLNTKALASFAQKTQQIDQPLAALNEKQINALYAPFLQLVGKGLSIHLEKAEIGTPQGPIHAQGQLTLPSQHGIPNLLILEAKTAADLTLQFPADILQIALSDFYDKHTSLPTKTNLTPKQLAKQTIKQWIASKALIPDGDRLKLSLTYQKGLLQINGITPSHPAPAKLTSNKPKSQKTHAH